MFDAVDDLVCRHIYEQDVAVLAHQLDYQLLVYRKAQFVDGLHDDLDDTVVFVLYDIADAGSRQMFTKDHAEHRRFRRVFGRFIHQISSGMISGR